MLHYKRMWKMVMSEYEITSSDLLNIKFNMKLYEYEVYLFTSMSCHGRSAIGN